MIEYVTKGMPDTLAHALAVGTAATAALADQIPAGVLNGVGVIGLVVFMYFALARGWIVTRREHEDTKKHLADMQDDRDKWQGIALRALGVAEKVTDAAEVLTSPDPKETTS